MGYVRVRDRIITLTLILILTLTLPDANGCVAANDATTISFFRDVDLLASNHHMSGFGFGFRFGFGSGEGQG